MKKILTLFLFFGFFSLRAQVNLVPNPSFEDFDSCSSTLFPLPGVGFMSDTLVFPCIKHWFRAELSQTVDLISDCDNRDSNRLSISFRNQAPRTGHAYCGIANYGKSYSKDSQTLLIYSEYPETRLITPLIKGHRYLCSFYANLSKWKVYNDVTSTFGFFFNYCAITNKNLTISFSDKYITAIDVPFIGPDPFIIAPSAICIDENRFLDDSLGWTKVSGIYTATGNERFLIIGNLDPLSNSKYKITIPSPLLGIDKDTAVLSYYNIDDVAVIDVTDFIIGDSNLCANELGVLSTNTIFEAYQWSDGSIERNAIIKGPGKYWCTITEGCDAYTDTFIVALKQDSGIAQQPKLEDDFTNCIEEKEYWPKTLSITPTSNKIIWSTGIFNTATISINNPGTYWVELRQGCDAKRDSIVVNGCPPPQAEIIIPNAFSPNNDNINDFLYLQIKDAQPLKWIIYNRWGEEVFHTDNNFYWSGYNDKGLPCNVGTYYFSLLYLDKKTSLEKYFKGSIELLK
jgi:gliding motility-associated-like protein